MNIIEQLKLMDKLSSYADEIISAYNENLKEFEPSDKAIF